jgi:hypothetical protein
VGFLDNLEQEEQSVALFAVHLQSLVVSAAHLLT